MKIAEKAVVPKEITDFYKALNGITSSQTESSVDVTLTGEQKELFTDQKVPLMTFIDFMPERNEINRIFREVCQIIVAHCPQVNIELEKIKSKLDVENKDLRLLLEQFIWQNEMYVDNYLTDRQINGEILSLVLFNVAKPLVKVYAKEIKNHVHFDKWAQNYCPVCGWKALIAVTSMKNQQRILNCSMCDTPWPFKNLACTHCSNEDHNTLKYISVKDDEVYKINVCEKCRGYIKTMDERKAALVRSSIEEDLGTIHLDIIAQREGYLKNATTTFKVPN